eukprot:CAMPEP_0119317382 /NCGR_PEP_ID=MMETSP1333-20130426/42974_1 /TAXON_ID=418940 /ORGANISM="Scyphosphaera apsteinii, Strain RCC1455" /LENGTH=289 /DNA_ID=CAMNT_0007323301 /DNA_START=25 /DNA_END=894 /DNA_ORIENTATION=+
MAYHIGSSAVAPPHGVANVTSGEGISPPMSKKSAAEKKRETRSEPALGRLVHPDIGLAGNLAEAGFRKYYVESCKRGSGEAKAVRDELKTDSDALLRRDTCCTSKPNDTKVPRAHRRFLVSGRGLGREREGTLVRRSRFTVKDQMMQEPCTSSCTPSMPLQPNVMNEVEACSAGVMASSTHANVSSHAAHVPSKAHSEKSASASEPSLTPLCEPSLAPVCEAAGACTLFLQNFLSGPVHSPQAKRLLLMAYEAERELLASENASLAEQNEYLREWFAFSRIAAKEAPLQ